MTDHSLITGILTHTYHVCSICGSNYFSNFLPVGSDSPSRGVIACCVSSKRQQRLLAARNKRLAESQIVIELYHFG